MSQLIYGKICYGVTFDEETEFPWDADEYDGDLEQWWAFGVQEFRHSFELFTPEGLWIDGVEAPQERQDQYNREWREFRDRMALPPVVLVEHCSHESPMFILAAPGTYRWSHRSSPVAFEPSNLVVSQAERQALLDFCETYGFEFEGEPGWYLCSYG